MQLTHERDEARAAELRAKDEALRAKDEALEAMRELAGKARKQAPNIDDEPESGMINDSLYSKQRVRK